MFRIFDLKIGKRVSDANPSTYDKLYAAIWQQPVAKLEKVNFDLTFIAHIENRQIGQQLIAQLKNKLSLVNANRLKADRFRNDKDATT